MENSHRPANVRRSFLVQCAYRFSSFSHLLPLLLCTRFPALRMMLVRADALAMTGSALERWVCPTSSLSLTVILIGFSTTISTPLGGELDVIAARSFLPCEPSSRRPRSPSSQKAQFLTIGGGHATRTGARRPTG